MLDARKIYTVDELKEIFGIAEVKATEEILKMPKEKDEKDPMFGMMVTMTAVLGIGTIKKELFGDK